MMAIMIKTKVFYNVGYGNHLEDDGDNDDGDGCDVDGEEENDDVDDDYDYHDDVDHYDNNVYDKSPADEADDGAMLIEDDEDPDDVFIYLMPFIFGGGSEL